MLHLEHAENEKEFMPKFKYLCAERELLMYATIWIVVITIKNMYIYFYFPYFVSFLPQSVIGDDNTAYQKRKNELFSTMFLEERKYTTRVT